MKNNQEQLEAINVNSIVDFTLVDPRATIVDIEKICDIAYKNQYYSVCVAPCNVAIAKGYILKHFEGSIKVCAVVGFPLGFNTMNLKVQEAKQMILEGADEIDVVINIGKAKCLDYEYVKDELIMIRKVAKKRVVKAIIETCYFDTNEIIKLCKICANAGVDFIETSTGFGTSGANEEIINIMLKETKGRCNIKASGGIRTRQEAVSYANAGVRRIGTSSVI